MRATMSTAGVLIQLVALASFSSCHASMSGTTHGKMRRNLQQFRPPNIFPFTRCGNLSSKGAPYYLFGPDWTVGQDLVATYTLGIGYKGRGPANFPCYTTLEKSMHKVMISIYSECIPALQVAGLTANVNGRLHPIHLYDYPTGAVLSVSKLGLNMSTVDGSTISFRAAAPCDTPKTLFRPNIAKKVPMEWAFSESSGHKCCGRSV